MQCGVAQRWGRTTLAGMVGFLATLTAGCGGVGSMLDVLGMPFPYVGGTGGTTGPGTSGRQTGSTIGTGTSGFTDPCAEPQARKFIRISMRNYAEDHVHYFMVLVAYVNGTEYPEGAVCPDDVALYTSFGYTQVRAGESLPFGNLCIRGPALVYFHRSGQFRSTGGVSGSTLASAVGPAQGASPTYDNAFTSAGMMVPVPNEIYFHNPGTTSSGQALKVSRSRPAPCDTTIVSTADPDCQQDAFYYVDETDRITGSTALGSGSGRRVASDIQGTGCECRGLQAPRHVLAPSGRSALAAGCDEFFRGGRIDFAFVREDTDPPYPQLLWRVTDASGATAHDFDVRANIR